MRKIWFLVVALAACVHLPHVDPKPRSPDDAQRAVVTLEVTCTSPGFPVGENEYETDEWSPARSGTGVVISERHILTAAHVVACPTIPQVTAYLSDGRRFMVDVIRDDAAFGDGADIAELESASAENFGLHLAPPALGYPIAGHALAFIGVHRGVGAYFDHGIVRDMKSYPGDSGAGVYDEYGQLVGLVSKRANDGSYTRIVPLTKAWLEGT
jgi:hypothetical protein